MLWNKRKNDIVDESQQRENKLQTLKDSAKNIVHKIAIVSSDTAIKYLEEDLLKIETEIKELEQTKDEKKTKEINMEVVMAYVEYFLENLEFLLLESSDKLKRAAYFGLLFDEAPTYQEILSGTPRLAPFIRPKDDLKASLLSKCDPTGSRIPVCRMRICRPRPLDDGAILVVGP